MWRKVALSLTVLILCLPVIASSQRRIPVLASHAIKFDHNTKERYKELVDAGFTLTFEYYSSLEEAAECLKTAEKTKIKLIIACPELFSDMSRTVMVLSRYKSFGGYYLCDEPSHKSFVEIKSTISRLRDLDDKHLKWINLFPSYAGRNLLGVSSYEKYVDDYLSYVNPDFVSFDFYGIKNSGLHSDYYNNLSIIASKSKQSGKPFWAYVLASQFNDYSVPTKGTISFQVFNNLAFGAQGIEYFSYRQIKNRDLDISISPLDVDYHKTHVFDYVKEVNKEIKYYSRFFYDCEIIDVSLLAKDNYIGMKNMEHIPSPFDSIDYDGKGFLVSEFTSNGKQYFLFVNQDYQNSQGLTILSNKAIRRMSSKRGERIRVKFNQKFTVEPGSIVLFRVL